MGEDGRTAGSPEKASRLFTRFAAIYLASTLVLILVGYRWATYRMEKSMGESLIESIVLWLILALPPFMALDAARNIYLGFRERSTARERRPAKAVTRRPSIRRW
jgi:hypothetical protein